MVSYAVVGASRGIGLEFVRQLATKQNATVFALVRNIHASTHLTAAITGLNNVHVLEADVTDHGALQTAANAASEITGGQLDCLIYNAALTHRAKFALGFDSFPTMDALDADFITAYKINVLGLIHSITAFLPLLSASTKKQIVVLGSAGADVKTVNTFGLPNTAAYSTTKAAALMVATKWAVQLKNEDFIVVTIEPGTVDTLGTVDDTELDPATREVFTRKLAANKAKTPAEAVDALLKVVDGLKPSDNGLFLSSTGEEYQVPNTTAKK